ncbi:MAG: transglycosylase domain-containing protein [Rikenellaceae bacterium]|nr:transglycosylase domain-containing protein [Rikenellaceae bacterium]
MAKKVIKKINKKVNNRKVIVIFWIILLFPFVFLGLLLLLTSIGVFGKLPSFEDLENPKSNLATEIYSEDGEMIGSFYVQNRSYTAYEELSPNLVAALVSTEDARFYSHSGIDFTSLARVAVKTVALGQKQGGGSTITQQLAKNLYKTRNTVTHNNKVARRSNLMISKLKEWITAVMLENNYTKEEIIAMYLNTVEYGSNAFGIKSAARTFFNKLPDELTIEEAAVLVGVVNAPTRYSPIRNPNNSLNRRNTVISRMETSGFITARQRDSLMALPIRLDFRPVSHDTGTGTYFREMLRQVMTMPRPQRSQYNNDWDYLQDVKTWDENPIYGWCVKNFKSDGTEYNLYRDGLKIYTTINATMQKYAEEALFEHLGEEVQPLLDKQVANSKTLFNKVSKEDVEGILNRAMRQTDRYRALKRDGVSDADILKNFNTPTDLRIFTYKGEKDTVMTPMDSIIYHKQILRGSFMAMDPISGHVKAYVGGQDFKFFKYDMVKQGKRQIGSTVKPFIYTFAIDFLGITPCTMVPNVQMSIETYNGEPWTPREASGTGSYDGVMHTLAWGLANSRNNYSAWIMKEARQPSAVADFINKMGIKSYIDPVPALCLGTADVSLFEMVGAYSTYVNRGVYTEPLFVVRIEDRHGNVLANLAPQTTDAISEQTANTMIGMLKNVLNGTAGRLRWMYKFTAEMGGKTGTSQNNSDAWFIGVTPNLVAGVWVGGEDRSVHLNNQADGARSAMPVFAGFMHKVYDDDKLLISQEDKFYIPPGAIEYNCLGATGYSNSRDDDGDFNVVFPGMIDEFFDY